MSDKKKVTKSDIVFSDDKIMLMSVYSKADITYFIQPCRDKYGEFPDCVKRVDSNGNMILSESERNDWASRKKIFIPENKVFEIKSGKVFDLTNMKDKAEWEAIKNCPVIAKDRDERDANGNLVIDGPIQDVNKAFKNGGVGVKNGVAELYIDRPGLDTQRKVKRKMLIHKAETYILEDEHGIEGQVNKARLLGKNMKNQPISEVIDYLLSVAKENPNKIIDLYTGTDTSLRLLLIEALEKHVIYVKNKLYIYGDNIVLGTSDDSVLTWMKEPKNLKILELIKRDTYPELLSE